MIDQRRNRVRFWGVRGSFPSPAVATARYGGNTSCVEVELGGERVIFDAGTGLRLLGRQLEPGGSRLHLLVSHTHWDHVQGLPLFAPLYRPDVALNIYALRRHHVSLREVFAGLWSEALFPVRFSQVGAELKFCEVAPSEAFAIGPLTVQTARLNHPHIAMGYRVECDGRAVAYVTDTAPFRDLLLETEVIVDRPDISVPPSGLAAETLRDMERSVVALARGVDLLIYDTQFTEQEYQLRPHWGHSTPLTALAVARAAGARTLCLFHHAPERSDEQVDQILSETAAVAGPALRVIAAREGMEVELP